VLASLAVSGLLRAFLFEMASIDPVTLVGVTTLVLAAAVAACYPPARRAATADTVRGLQGDGLGSST
jgi:ABC-type antimicrobial peptide transport system permease subunit